MLAKALRGCLGTLVFAVALPSLASAQAPSENEPLRAELARVRAELQALREEHNRRLDELRVSVAALQSQSVPQPAPQPTAPVPAGAAGA